MEVLITSKTRKGKAACVGGLIINNNRFVRLLNQGNWDQFVDTDFMIGDVWDINFSDRLDSEPPHTEDVIIQAKRYIKKIRNITDFIIKSGIPIYRGNPSNIFNGLLRWTSNGSGYIGDKNNLPEHSVGFWISDKDLFLQDDEKHFVYQTNNRFTSNKRFKYVGFENTMDKIPAGTLLRVSLARWWKPEETDVEERCYLQLSGWY